MAKTRYNAVTPRPKSDGGTWWHRVGSAYENARGMTIYLDSVPVPDPDRENKIVIMLFEAKDEDRQERPQQERSEPQGDMDDEVPF